ncbi:hypothetical protein V8C42DRAFT_336669 [Trichoderma barbatum]
MDGAITPSGLEVIRDEEYNSSTQPFSSPGPHTLSKDITLSEDISRDISRDIDDATYDNGDADGDADTDYESTVTDESGQNEHTASIDCSYSIHSVNWKDANNQTKCIQGLELDIYLDTWTNTAMFKLYTYINLKLSRRKNKKQRVYLFIYPEWIKAITAQISPDMRYKASDTTMPNQNFYSLHFFLTQKPDLIGPRNNSLASKPKTNNQLDLIQDLALATEFEFQLTNSTTAPLKPNVFKLLAASFSPLVDKNRPSRNKKRGNLATLYAGKGGVVVSASKALAQVEAGPPPYASATVGPRPVLNKRRRCDSDANGDRLSVTRMLPFIQDIYTRLNARLDEIETGLGARLDDIETGLGARLDDIGTRFGTLDRSLGQIKDTLESLNTGRTPCRYDTEEREGILQDVKDVCEDIGGDLRLAAYDVIEDLEKERDMAIVQVKEECEEITSQCKDEVKEAQENIHAIKTRLTKTLQNTSMQFNGTLVLDI